MGYVIVGLVSAAIAFVSGLVGLGGAILLIPVLLVITPILVPDEASIAVITGATSFQVLATTLVGVTVHGMRGMVSPRLVLVMGSAIAVSAFTGALLSGAVGGQLILGAFTLLATAAALMMLLPRRDEPDQLNPTAFRIPTTKAGVAALAIGFWGGLVGAPGGFVLVPTIIHVLGLPTRVAVGSALGIVLISAVATVSGKLAAGVVPLGLTLAVVAGAVPGAYAGSRLSHRVPVRWLKRVLGFIMGGVALRLWIELLQG